MAYTADIPQPGDNPSQSQGQILGNFQAIQTLIDVNHADFASAQAGNHIMVTLVDQTGGLPAAPTGTNLNIYNAQDGSGVNQVYLQGPAATRFATAFPFTQCHGTNSGWTYLPSGILMWWFTTGAITAPSTTINYITSVPSFVGFTNAPAVFAQLRTTPSTAPLYITSATSTQCVVTTATNASVYLFAIGN